jgi:hypothetical protein
MTAVPVLVFGGRLYNTAGASKPRGAVHALESYITSHYGGERNRNRRRKHICFHVRWKVNGSSKTAAFLMGGSTVIGAISFSLAL